MTNDEAITRAMLYGATFVDNKPESPTNFVHYQYRWMAVDKDGVRWYGYTQGEAARKLVAAYERITS